MQFHAVKDFILEKLQRELPVNLSYHSIDHVMDVYHAAGMIAEGENINGVEKKLLLTAALFHDSGFIVAMKGHEIHSCEFAKQYLPEFEYSPSQLDKICGMIMATRLPQQPHSHVEEVICDADLDYLGRDDFFTTGNRLFDEFLRFGVVKNEVEWDLLQVKFLEAHHYFTKTSKRLRSEKKAANLALLKQKLNKSAANEKT